jgi:hypothetical protein
MFTDRITRDRNKRGEGVSMKSSDGRGDESWKDDGEKNLPADLYAARNSGLALDSICNTLKDLHLAKSSQSSFGSASLLLEGSQKCRNRLVDSGRSHVALTGVECLCSCRPHRRVFVDERTSNICNNRCLASYRKGMSGVFKKVA